MDLRVLAALTLAAVALLPLAAASSTCPANNPNIGPYTKVEVLPKGYKVVDKQFTVKVTRTAEGVESPLAGRTVTIYLMNGTRETKLASGNTNSKGEYYYTPKHAGKYKVESSGRAPTFDVVRMLTPSEKGAVCGNGICEDDKGEDKDNCEVDCMTCGDGICEGLEDKDNCPDDCIICGDDVCDEPEYWPGGCSCLEDCVKCGDKICDTAHGENSTNCKKDCKGDSAEGPSVDFLSSYWWVLVIIAIAGLIVLKRERPEVFDRIHLPKRSGKHKERQERHEQIHHSHEHRSGRKSVEEDEDLSKIIIELMDSGISEKRIKEKLKEFGLDDKEAGKLIEKAKG